MVGGSRKSGLQAPILECFALQSVLPHPPPLALPKKSPILTPPFEVGVCAVNMAVICRTAKATIAVVLEILLT